MNLHLSQTVQDGEVGGHSGSKYQNERKRKTPDEGFSDHEDNSSSGRDIRESKSKKKKSSKGHKRSMRKRSSYSSTSSSSSSWNSSTGSESSSDDDERSKPKSKKHKTSHMDQAMFHVQTDEKHEYNLPKKLLKYADHYLKKFIPTPSLTLTPCTL